MFWCVVLQTTTALAGKEIHTTVKATAAIRTRKILEKAYLNNRNVKAKNGNK